MKLLLKAWLPLLAIIALCILIYLCAYWSSLTATYKLSCAVAIVIVLHMMEEERFPGGFGYMFNVVVWKSAVPDRYPMSPLIAMVVDVVIFFILFVPALVFPQFIWLAIAPMFLAIGELIVHGVVVGIFLQWRRDGRSIYNPGLATACVLGGIAGIFIYVVLSNGLAAWTDWVWGFLYFVSAMLVGLVLPEQGMKSKTTPWGFEHQHFLGYYSRYTTLEEVLGRRATT